MYTMVYIKKKPTAAIWIDQIIILSDDRERQTSDIAYIVHQKNDTNQVCICLQNRNNHRLRIQTYGHQMRTVEGKDKLVVLGLTYPHCYI